MDIQIATAEYEHWLGRRLTLLRGDLTLKHRRMREGAFAFLRATFYRWVQLWDDHAGDLADAPRTLAVGDLHVENFGTWRDREGRLIWGVNDVDEAAYLPSTFDLVRLATSARMAIGESALALDPRDAADALLQGYRDGIEQGGRPFVLAEHHHELRALAVYRLRDPEDFWAKLGKIPKLREPPGAVPRALLARALPRGSERPRFAHRIAGLGSLGRQRYIAVAECDGGLVAREVKALAPSAVAWARGGMDERIYCQRVADRAVRSADPDFGVERGWLVRRLAPDCSRIPLAELPKQRDELILLCAMGWETANIHLGSTPPKALLAGLRRRSPHWLDRAAEEMEEAVMTEWRSWRGSRKK